ncbi:MAG: 16S rRNA (guanine(527)-N(7))-methyltransferase RsmG [Planctomycetota bacterium]
MSGPMDETEFNARFAGALADWEVPDLPRLARHAWLVRQKNDYLNLTRIVEPEEMATRHVLDSIVAAPLLEGTPESPITRVLDLGTGAGWPGLAIAIAGPHLSVTLLDARRKKIDFLGGVVADLGLEDRVECVWSRFEDFIRDERKGYDVVLARAVGPTLRLLEWCTNRWFGPLLLWKGPRLDEELFEAGPLMKKRKLGVALDLDYQLPGDEAKHTLVMIDWV